MTHSDVTIISLVTDKSRNAICQSLVPSVSRALSNQHATFKRLPVTRDYIDWVVDDTDTLTVAIDEVGFTSVLVIASKGPDAQLCVTRLANVAADLCQLFDAHTVLWNGADQPIPAEDFLAAVDSITEHPAARTRIIPRKVKATKSARSAQRCDPAKLDNWMLRALRAQMNGVTLQEVEQLEVEARRATSAPMRLAAWALSFTTAIIALPLAFPLIIHNAVRGEDVRAGAMMLGVAGLYAGLAQSGMVPGLAGIL
jgi:hypothetical protein